MLLCGDCFKKLSRVGGDDFCGVTYCCEGIKNLKTAWLAKVASDQDAHADELRVGESEFFDEKVVAEDVDVFVVDNASDHFVRSEDKNVRVGGINGVNFALLLKRDTGDFGFSGALDEWDPKNLAQGLCLIKVLWLEIHSA